MAEWVVGPVMEKIIDSCYDYLKDQVRWQTGLPEELQRLRDISPTIQSVVSSYSQLQMEDPALNKWLWKLRDAVDEADDVLDEIEYKKHEKQVISQNTKTRSVMKSLKKIGKRALKIDPTLKRLEEAVHKLDKIATEVSNFQTFFESRRKEQEKQQDQQQQKMRKARETGATPTDKLLGRSMEMEFLSKWLSNLDQTEISTEDFYKNISLLSVVGHGGMGKTTLLQHVYDDDVVTKEFGVKAWVCVSDNFDAKTVITDILESFTKERPRLEKLDALQKSLKSEVESTTFLLVLDDIWEDDEEEWKKVLVPLSHGSSVRKILITTRMESIASMFAQIIKKNNKTLQLAGLEKDECLQLLNTHAFAGEENLDVHKRLSYITGEMVNKLSGSPLAAKVIGGILSFNLDANYWRKVLYSDIGNINPGQNLLLPILKLSYIYLPNHLQNCFSFCAIFPQDHKFKKEDLVRMWIAVGFILPQNIQEETLEDIGERYFDILVKKSFFDKFQSDFDKVYFKMHDLLHELARFVSTEECARVVDDRYLSIPPTIRHLSIHTSSLETTFKKVGEFKNLRSLFLSFSKEANYDENSIDLLSGIFKVSKSIRLLSIFATELRIEMIPDAISSLIHLRYLHIEQEHLNFQISISHLYHLQFLIYNFTFGNGLLPRDLNNLYNLRYLSLDEFGKCMIYEIGKLKSLQRMDRFFIKNEIGYGIGELEHMNELRQIDICQLENIKDVKEVCGAKFCDKKNLMDLSLNWSDDFEQREENTVDHDLDEKVLDSIQPNKNLERLCIFKYMGVRSAKWMNDVYFTSSNLEYIRLEKCSKWKTLPPFGQLPFLKSLYLLDMDEVKKIDNNKNCMFPSLEVLHIESLQELQEWFDTTLAENGCLLPCLTELKLKFCSKLQELPYFPTKLQNLEMLYIPWKSCNWLQGIKSCSHIDIGHLPNLIHLIGRKGLKTDGNCQLIIDELEINDLSVLLMVPLRNISSLRLLTIKENDEVVSFPIETEQWFLQLISSLYELKFCHLQSLHSLPSSLGSFSSLNTLYVFDVPQLKMLPKLPSSLQTLELNDVESLESLPSCLSTISSLKNFTLKGTSHLKSLPDLPSSLEWLVLCKLDSLQCMPSSLSTISALNFICLSCISLLESLPDFPSSLKELQLKNLQSLECLPSLSTISSLTKLKLKNIPRLQSLPDLPSSLEELEIKELESLLCLPSSLSTISSFTMINIGNIPLLKLLPDLPSSLEMLWLKELESLQCLPSSLSTISALHHLKLNNIPHLKSLPDLPSSLKMLELEKLESLQCLPSSLSTISFLIYLKLKNIPLLKSLADLPSSLSKLHLEELENLDCLPSCPPTLHELYIIKVTQLLELPDLPDSLGWLTIEDCHPQFMERYTSFSFWGRVSVRKPGMQMDFPA